MLIKTCLPNETAIPPTTFAIATILPNLQSLCIVFKRLGRGTINSLATYIN